MLNRAQAFLKLGHFERAICDADSILEVDPLNFKGLYRSATALYKDGQFDDAKARLVTLLKIYPGNAEAKAMLLRTYRRLHEARTGEYDFSQLRNDTKQCG
jgi:tetratricopeptide (TPR) repeat protein